MLHFSRWKLILIFSATLLGVFFVARDLVPKETVDAMSRLLPFRQMALGFDLRGGSRVLLQLSMDDLKKSWLDTIRDDAREILHRDHIGYANLHANKEQVEVTIRSAEQIDAAYSKLRAMARPAGGSGVDDLEVIKGNNGAITVRPTETGMRDRTAAAMDATVETVRRRIDSLGVIGPLIQRQGLDRIVVQASGLKNPDVLTRVLSRMGKLAFQLVDQSMTVEDARTTHAPPGAALYPDARKEGMSYLLKTKAVVSGEDLVSVQAGFDSQASEAVVNFRFNISGARRFADATRENVGKPFAIVLDGKVLSAPVIRTPILDGVGQISGRFTMEEANEFSILLRSGSLPAKLDVIEERAFPPVATSPAASQPAPSLPATEEAAPATGRRVALVLGNSVYQNAPRLPNPASDAHAVAAALGRLGFEVTLKENLGGAAMRAVLSDFEDTAGRSDWAVVYYAGHGMQLDGKTWLIPTDARLRRASDAPDEAVPLDRVLDRVRPASRLRMVMLDACRDNPFLAQMESSRGVGRGETGRGLARIEPQHGELVFYAARDGQIAQDGPAEHSPFASALLASMEEPGLELGRLLRRVTSDVLKSTNSQQEPFVYGRLPDQDFFFKSGAK